MRLTTLDDLGNAKRLSRPVQVINPEDDEIEAIGVIIEFNDQAVTILEYSVGVVHFLLENVEVWELDQPLQ